MSHTAPDCRTIFIIYPESGVYVHACPLIGNNSQCAVASNQNSMAEGASLLAKTQHVWGDVLTGVRVGAGRNPNASLKPPSISSLLMTTCKNFRRSYVPKNTAVSTKWALKNLQAWKDIRNLKFPVPENPQPQS